MFKKALGFSLIVIMFCALCSEASGYFLLKNKGEYILYGDINLLKASTEKASEPAMFEFIPKDKEEGKSIKPTGLIGMKGKLVCIVGGEKTLPLFFGIGWKRITEKRSLTGTNVWVMRTSKDNERTLHNFLTPLWSLDVEEKGLEGRMREVKKVVSDVKDELKKGVDAIKKAVTPKSEMEKKIEQGKQSIKAFGKDLKEKWDELTEKK